MQVLTPNIHMTERERISKGDYPALELFVSKGKTLLTDIIQKNLFR